VRALADDVRAYLRGDAVAARPDTPLQASLRWIGRHKLAALITMAVLALGAAVAIIGLLIAQERALEADYQRDTRIEAFQLAVARHGHRLDSRFYRFEEQLARLAGHASEVLARAEDDDEMAPVYLATDFDDPARAPPDLIDAPALGLKASLNEPVFVVPGRLARHEVEGELRRLRHLRLPLADTLLMAAGEMPDALDAAEARRRLLVEGGPALRAFVTLGDGVHISLPGHGGYPADYDARMHPAYELARNTREIRWGDAMSDAGGGAKTLPAATTLFDADGEIVGIAGLELTFSWVADHLLELPGAELIEAGYLVRRDGSIVVHAAAPGARDDDAATAGGEGSTLERLPWPAVRAALADGRAGRVELDHDGALHIVAFYPIDSVDGYLVVIADEARLLAAEPIDVY
jgi:eukaryotic-like serine/threonine-protein kinase